VQPQLYLLRWLRLLFGREFHLSDSMLVWDALFAYGQARAHPPTAPKGLRLCGCPAAAAPLRLPRCGCSST